MNRRNKKVLLSLVVFTLISIMLIGSISNTKAEVNVDTEKEQEYDYIIQINGYNISYCNDDVFHYVFVEAPNELNTSTIEISNDEFYYDISPEHVETSYLESMHLNKFLEIKIKREIIGNAMNLVMDLDTFMLSLAPKSDTEYYHTSSNNDDDDGKEKKVAQITFFDWLASATNDWYWYHFLIVGILIGMLGLTPFILAWRYKSFPIVEVQDGDEYKHVKIGRYIEQEKSKLLPDYWILRFKCGKGVEEYYCTENFPQIESTLYKRIYIIQKMFPHYIKKTLPLSEDKWFYKQVPANGFVNKLYYYMLRTMCYLKIPNNYIAKELYNSIEWENSDEVVKEVPLLQYDLTTKQLTTIGDIVYDQYIADEKKKELKYSEKHEGKLITKENEPYWKYLDLMKDKTIVPETLKFIEKEVDVISMTDIKKAIEYRNTLNNERSTNEYLIRELRDELKKSNEYLIDARRMITKLEVNFNLRLADELADIHNQSMIDPIKLLKSALGKVKSGADVETAIKSAFKEVYESENYTTNIEQEKKMIQIQSENKLLKEELGKIADKFQNSSRVKKVIKKDDLTME